MSHGKKASTAKLDRLIEEATVDAYGDEEEATGLYTMMEEHLPLPFRTNILGVEVEVRAIELREAGQIVALCSRGRTRQAIRIVDVPLPRPPPEGAEWIEAYRRWAARR